jgi:hypothetical protein
MTPKTSPTSLFIKLCLGFLGLCFVGILAAIYVKPFLAPKVEKEFSIEKIYVDRIYMHGVNDFSVAVIDNGEVCHFKPIEVTHIRHPKSVPSVEECKVRIFLDVKEDEKPWVLVCHPRMEIHIHSLNDIQSVGM